MSNRIYSRISQHVRIAAVLTCGLLAACAAGAGPEDPPGPEALVVEQLARSSETLAAKGLSIRLVDYAAATPLDTEDAVRLVKAHIVDSDAVVPQYNGMDAASLQLSTIRERTQALAAGDDAQDVIANIEAMVFPSIKVGQKVLDVVWESQGRQFQTKLIYDDSGVVYDNLLSNIAVVEVTEVAEQSPPKTPAAARGDGAVPLVNQSFSTRFFDGTIQWVWGGTRGKIELDHYVISCDNWFSFCDDGGQANAWMSVGSAQADTHRNALVYPRISKLAWAWAWATPTASFSISFDWNSLTFSASISGVGSAGKGTGIHTIF